MVHLLDVNVLISLFDPMHANHDAAHEWFGAVGVHGWATCPITENGFVRIVCSPRYPTVEATPQDAANRLRTFIQSATAHEFWADDISITDNTRFNHAMLSGPNLVTDAYLLALAADHGGKLATFDRRITSQTLANPITDAIELL